MSRQQNTNILELVFGKCNIPAVFLEHMIIEAIKAENISGVLLMINQYKSVKKNAFPIHFKQRCLCKAIQTGNADMVQKISKIRFSSESSDQINISSLYNEANKYGFAKTVLEGLDLDLSDQNRARFRRRAAGNYSVR